MDLLWNQIRSHFGEIIDLPAKDRPAALAQLDKDAPTMAAEVRRLVSNFEEAKSFLEVPVIPIASQANENAPVTLKSGAVIAGRYEIRKLLGVGGMGEVYQAWDREMRLLLALKVLPPHLGSRSEMVDRFPQHREACGFRTGPLLWHLL